MNTINIFISCKENIQIFTRASHTWKYWCFHYTRWQYLWYSQDKSKYPLFILLTILRRWSRCWSYSLLLCGLFYDAVCFMSCLVLFCSCVFSPFSITITSLGEERAIVSVLLVMLFDLLLFDYVCFLFLLVSGMGCGFCLSFLVFKWTENDWA